jgi:hypothetical protein
MPKFYELSRACGIKQHKIFNGNLTANFTVKFCMPVLNVALIHDLS